MAPNTEQVVNPFGLEAFVKQLDEVGMGTLIILIIMSLVSWYVIFTKLWDQRRVRVAYKEVEKGFWTAGNLRDGVAKLKGNDNVFKMIVEDGLKAAQHHEGRLTDQIPLHEWITISLYRSSDSVNSRMSNGLSVLATVGSTAPFVGLFGTVWGIYHALIAIGLAGQASIYKVAGPVGEALIMTAFGLFVAVPAVLGYNWLIRRNKAVQDGLRNFAADLHAYLISGARVGVTDQSATTGGARPVAAPAAAVRK